MNDAGDVAVIYSPFGSREAAVTAAHVLIEERLLACANVLPGMTSLYHWQGAVQTGTEALLIGKTRAALVAPAMTRLRELHPYDVPCITSWPVAACDRDYAKWVRDSTQTSPGRDDRK